MAKGRMDLSAFVGKLLEEQDGDVLREGIRVLSQAVMESEVAGLIGADRYERTSDSPIAPNHSVQRFPRGLRPTRAPRSARLSAPAFT